MEADRSHELADPTVRDHHLPGWRYQLSAAIRGVAELDKHIAAIYGFWSA